MRLFSILALVYISLPLFFAFIGHGIEMYNPSCAFACRAAIASAPLSCSGHGEGGHSSSMGHGGAMTTTPECRAGDTAFLTTLAWCVNSTCAQFNIEAWRLEKYWGEQATGAKSVVPKWTYAKAIQQVTEPPKQQLEAKEILNGTATVSNASWEAQKRTLEHFAEQETLHARYGYGFGVLSIK